MGLPTGSVERYSRPPGHHSCDSVVMLRRSIFLKKGHGEKDVITEQELKGNAIPGEEL